MPRPHHLPGGGPHSPQAGPGHPPHERHTWVDQGVLGGGGGHVLRGSVSRGSVRRGSVLRVEGAQGEGGQEGFGVACVCCAFLVQWQGGWAVRKACAEGGERGGKKGGGEPARPHTHTHADIDCHPHTYPENTGELWCSPHPTATTPHHHPPIAPITPVTPLCCRQGDAGGVWRGVRVPSRARHQPGGLPPVHTHPQV